MEFENHPHLGNGIYTVSDIASFLRIPYHKAYKWITSYWDEELGGEFNQKYSWSIDDSKAVSFHTLVEFYVMIMFAEAGVKTRKVLEAHKELSDLFDTPFPYANKKIIDNIKTDGKRIYFELNGSTISLDGTKQLNLNLIKVFFKNIEFDDSLIASKLWPLGKTKNIIIDPKRQFGHPVIDNTNIYPETIFNLFQAGEPIEFIAYTYELEEKDVKDAIEFCQAA